MQHITGDLAPDTAPTVRPVADHQEVDLPALEERRGCLFALSQPPLMLFLTVIGGLLLIAGVHDHFLL
ncbi:hypothetical protein [Streptomyces millisiae]|uniref:Uncharacterized protein n=1 Tax=Streptomyces millisiae TaxID=3075542 RepID=A0ABU2LT11_9ACTN|nr:hypothetical protein [Streptomyces sp. DSM 44918]MDT0320717.1 hypothetical protein [Streptomyces sp. DSM 44918]